MWLFLSDSFLSIVQHPKDKSILVVRARRPGDIEQIFPRAHVFTLEGRDYQFRAEVDRKEVADAIARQVMEIQHTNFKNSVHDHDYHEACSRVWGIMAKLQQIPPYHRGRAPAPRLSRGQRRLEIE
jgi:hypothetical protein